MVLPAFGIKQNKNKEDKCYRYGTDFQESTFTKKVTFLIVSMQMEVLLLKSLWTL